jgi:hypothetical protein
MSYTNNPTSILAGTGITVTPSTGTGANIITVSATGTSSYAIRIATTSPITVDGTTDDVISVQVAPQAPVAVTLPVGVTGSAFTIKDGLGLANNPNPITITPQVGDTIDGAATATISAPYGALTFIYDGVEWLII